MKELLLKERGDLMKSLEGLKIKQSEIATQIMLHEGALQHNTALVSRLEEMEAFEVNRIKAETAKRVAETEAQNSKKKKKADLKSV